MSTAAPAADPVQKYAFRFDLPLEPIVFGGEADLHGWLLHEQGKPIHGIRAVVERPWGSRTITAARRKRNRPDVAAAFPDLPEAESSGFLIELRLGLGRSRITFQVRDHEKVWRTFGTATVSALPLTFLSRLGLTNVRQFLVSHLSQRYAARHQMPNSWRSGNNLAAPAPQPITTRRVELFATSKSNLFIVEIGELVAAGFRELGCEATLHLDRAPEEQPPDDVVQIVVTPHEFYNLFLSEQLAPAAARRLTRGCYLLCTEQPETGWFHSNLQWSAYARGVADINPLGVAAYRARGLPAQQLQLGYHPILAHPQRIPHRERTLDITFLGSMTERREEFFSDHADFFAQHRCHLRLVPLGFAKTKQTKSYLSVARRNKLLSQSRILLNIHYSEQNYFEWHRMLIALSNGCCIITETCKGYGALVPGEHFVMVEPEYLITACDYYLAHPEECERIATAGLHFIENELRQSSTCRAFLQNIETRGAVVPFAAALDSPATPLPEALRRQFSRHTGRVFRRALQRDLRAWSGKAPEEERKVVSHIPTTVAEQQRAGVVRKREAYKARLTEQEERRARGESVWQVHENATSAQTAAPRLSVLITLYNYAQHLDECVESVTRAAEHLAEPPEIVIVNDASTDGSLARAIAFQRNSALPVRVVDKQFNTGLADARNTALQLARAPFVFMLDADNLIYPRALQELLAAISAGPSAAAYSLLCRFRGRISNRVGLLSYYDFDPEILAQYPYIDAMAMFDRETLLQLGGYDNQLSQIGWFGWEDYNMWLKIAQRELPVAFVPNTLCLYRHHDTSMINTTNLFETELVQHFIAHYGELLERFQPREKVFGVERQKLGGRSDGRRRVLIASGCSIATTSIYRCVHLKEQFHALRHEAEVVDWSDESNIDPEAAARCDLLVLYRLGLSAPLERAIEQARKAGATIIFDVDDLVFEPELLEAHRAVRKLNPAEREQHLLGVRSYLATLELADVVTTATEPLAEHARRRGKQAFVHRNALGGGMLAVANHHYARAQGRSREQVVIGYGSGTATHDDDFAEAAPALLQVLQGQPRVELWIAGPLTLPPEFEERVRRFPFTGWEEWFELASTFDIALAPLERENVFCAAKSEVKFIETGALGVPLVATDVEPYRFAITDGDDGILVRTTDEWVAALTYLIEQPELRREMGKRARHTVLQRYSPSARTADLETLLSSISVS